MARTTRNQVKALGENASLALIILGTVVVCQPFVTLLYPYGFSVLLIGTLGYIIFGRL